MAQNKKTQRKFRKKSSKRNVGKRKTKVKRKMKGGGNCYEVYDTNTKKSLNLAHVNYTSFIQNVYFTEPEIIDLKPEIDFAQLFLEGVKDEDKKVLEYLLNSKKDISDFTNMINEKPIHTLVIGIEYIIRTNSVFTTVDCNSQANKNLRSFYIKDIKIIYLAIELITQSLQKIIGSSDIVDKCKRKKSWRYAITPEYVQCIENKITIYAKAINAIEYLIIFFQQMDYLPTTPEQNIDITYHVELLTAEEKKISNDAEKNKKKSEKERLILKITPTLCKKLRTLLSISFLSKPSLQPKQEAIQLLRYCKQLLEKKTKSKRAKVGTSSSIPETYSSDTNNTYGLTPHTIERQKFLKQNEDNEGEYFE